MNGSTFRRCSCRNPETGKQYGGACPKLRQRSHGQWSVRQELPYRADGSRRQFRRTGFATATAAATELDKVRALLSVPDADDLDGLRAVGDLLEALAKSKDPIPDSDDVARRLRSRQDLNTRFTVGEWLDRWLAGKKRLRASTAKRYDSDIRTHLKPHIGGIRIDHLQVHHLDDMFAAIDGANQEIIEANLLRRQAINDLRMTRGRAARHAAREAIAALPPFRRPTGLASQHHIKRTLRAALNVAVARQLITFNAAKHVELEPAKRPKPVLWTDERVSHWRATGEKPSPVMVWTPGLTGQFLDSITEDPLYALFHLLCFQGLRRGEACGARKIDIDWAAETLTIATQLVQDGWDVAESIPKTDSGSRTIAVDSTTLKLLKAHLANQATDRLAAGDKWTDTGRIFTREDGSWLHPGLLTDYFERLVTRADLPPVRLHDLRHGAATLAFAAGADLKLIQAMLGHSSITVTADTYTSILPEVSKAVANAAVNLVPRAGGKRTAE